MCHCISTFVLSTASACSPLCSWQHFAARSGTRACHQQLAWHDAKAGTARLRVEWSSRAVACWRCDYGSARAQLVRPLVQQPSCRSAGGVATWQAEATLCHRARKCSSVWRALGSVQIHCRCCTWPPLLEAWPRSSSCLRRHALGDSGGVMQESRVQQGQLRALQAEPQQAVHRQFCAQVLGR